MKRRNLRKVRTSVDSLISLMRVRYEKFPHISHIVPSSHIPTVPNEISSIRVIDLTVLFTRNSERKVDSAIGKNKWEKLVGTHHELIFGRV